MKFKHLPVRTFRDCTQNFEQLQATPAGGGGVEEVFGRPGPKVVAKSGDYTPAQVGAVPLTENVETLTVEGNISLGSPLSFQVFRLTIATAEPKITVTLAAGQSYQVYVIQDNSGARKPLFIPASGSLRWGEPAPYEATATAKAEDWLAFSCSATGKIDGVVNAKDLK